MVTRSGVKLLDFGLAQLRVPEGGSDSLPATSSDIPLTSAGVIFGTLPYMSPEQVEGQKVDARSDIFSFGSVLYKCSRVRGHSPAYRVGRRQHKSSATIPSR